MFVESFPEIQGRCMQRHSWKSCCMREGSRSRKSCYLVIQKVHANLGGVYLKNVFPDPAITIQLNYFR